MIKKAFTLQLDGEVTLARLYQALEAWNSTLETISDEIDRDHSHSIFIDDLLYGSAIAVVGIDFDQETLASQFETSFISVARNVRNNSVSKLPKPLQKPGQRLQEVAKMDSGSGFTLSSEESDFLIDPSRWFESPVQSIAARVGMDNLEAFGAVSGKLQSLNSRGALKVTVYDELNDKAVRVSLTEEQHEVVRGLWDQKVVVEGLVRRDPDSGRPLSINQVRRISRKEEPEDPFAWRRARGVLSHIRPETNAEQLIREARNA